MTTQSNPLLAAVRANTLDRTARLVCADWLEEHDASHLARYVRAEVLVASAPPGSPEWEGGLAELAACCRDAGANLGGWEYEADLARLREKIDRLRALDGRKEVFGAANGRFGHGYHLHPPVAEADLLKFELRHSLVLPGEYRAFLLRVGNGGVGPDYGLFPLDLSRDYPELRRPFAITPELAGELAAAVDRAQRTRDWRGFPELDDEVWGAGYLELCEHGCGNESVLVVNGPLRGQMWWQGDPGLVPERTLGFLAWYEEWLDRWLAPGEIERWAARFRR
jgi:uncharacterized protein (TIGR02996 family)